MSFRVFCDLCQQVLKRNMVSERLTVESGKFSAEVSIWKNGIADDGDLCYSCLLKMLNLKPKRKYVRKQTPQPEETPSNVDTALHCSKCGMVTTTLVDDKPLCLVCQAEYRR